MDSPKFHLLVETQCGRIQEMLLEEKAQEYNTSFEEDMLSHFREMQRLCGGIHPILVCKMYFLRQVLSLNAQLERWDLMNNPPVLDEMYPKLENRIDDTINYLILMKALITETKEKENGNGRDDTRTEETD